MSQVCDLSAFYDIREDVLKKYDEAFEMLLGDDSLMECEITPAEPAGYEKCVSDRFEYDLIDMTPDSLMAQIQACAADCWEVVSFVGDMILIRREKENVH